MIQLEFFFHVLNQYDLDLEKYHNLLVTPKDLDLRMNIDGHFLQDDYVHSNSLFFLLLYGQDKIWKVS